MKLNAKAFNEVNTFFHDAYGEDGCSAKWRSYEEETAYDGTTTTTANTTAKNSNNRAPSPGFIPALPQRINPRDRFLPTAIVCAGLNLSDHGKTFDGLKKHFMLLSDTFFLLFPP